MLLGLDVQMKKSRGACSYQFPPVPISPCHCHPPNTGAVGTGLPSTVIAMFVVCTSRDTAITK